MLADTLDMTWSGAQGLRDLYEYMYGEPIAANLGKDSRRVANCLRVAGPLAATWREAAQLLAAQSLAGQGRAGQGRAGQGRAGQGRAVA